jgi:hypothetical protein
MPRKKDRTLESVRYGVELEVEFKSDEISQKLIEKHRIIRGWKVDYDGSLDAGAEYKPTNGNKLHYNEDSIDQIKEIIGLIKAHKGHIRPTCGGHVHIDMSQFTNQEIVNIVKAFVKKQKGIYRKFRVLKSRSDDHARKIPKEVLTKLDASIIKNIKSNEYGSNESDYFSNRDFGLNILSLGRHGTLEFRLFSGSIQISTWKTYIKFAINFCLNNAKGK